MDLVPGDAATGRVDWRFTTAAACFRLKRLYPTIHEEQSTSSTGTSAVIRHDQIACRGIWLSPARRGHMWEVLNRFSVLAVRTQHHQ